jgi:hypothetical protein
MHLALCGEVARRGRGEVVEINPWRGAASATGRKNKLGVIGEVELERAVAKAPDTNITKSLVEFDKLATTLGGCLVRDSLIAMATKGSNHVFPELVDQLDPLDLLDI